MEHLSATLKKGGIKDLFAFFPPNKREAKFLEEHFKKAGIPQVAEWWAKKQYAVVKEGIIKELSETLEREESVEQVRKRALCCKEVLTARSGYCYHQNSPGRITYTRVGVGAMYLAGSHGLG